LDLRVLTEQLDLSGGIVQVPASCKENSELKNGVGVTVYHFVESIDEVYLLYVLWVERRD
jgi:hypothetical protein